MAEIGFSGEPRYALPGVALVAVSAGAGAARLAEAISIRRTALAHAALAAVLLVPAIAVAAGELRPLPGRLQAHAELVADLDAAIGRAGGRAAVLACGRPAVGRYRGTLAAYALDVPKRAVRADGRPDAVTLRSRLTPGAALSPPSPPGARTLAAAGRWRIEVAARCVSARPSAGRSGARAR
jgi:hypothetical protein